MTVIGRTDTVQLDRKTRKKVDQGRIVTTMVDSPDGKGKRAGAVGFIDAPIEQVWEAITDYEHYAEFMPATASAEVLGREGNKVRFRSTLKFPIKTVSYTIELTLDAEGHRVDWTLVEGTMSRNDGSWNLQAESGGTLAEYTLALELDLPVPGFLLNKAVRTVLPTIIDAIRKRVGAA